MRLCDGPWLELDEVDSTQAQAASLVQTNDPAVAVLARHQTAGRGRFGRTWHSRLGDSLCLSLILRDQKGHSRPWLFGMALAAAAAGALHCRVRWPNDLFLDGKKLGGVLTEIVDGVPILGIGVNLNQPALPDEIAAFAISLAQARGGSHDPKAVGRKIVARLDAMPEIQDWPDLAPIWSLYDDTPGKRFRLAADEEAVAVGIGPHGELLCSVDGESRTVMAAEAILG